MSFSVGGLMLNESLVIAQSYRAGEPWRAARDRLLREGASASALPKLASQVHLVTAPDDGNIQEQRECLDGVAEACSGTGADFTWAFDGTGGLHARDITTDTGWKLVLDRGLDIFQPTPRKPNGFSLGERMQDHRMIRSFYVTCVKAS